MTNIMCHPERNAVSKALRVILSEATLVAKPKDLGGPALPRRHALFYGPVPGLCPVPHLVKPSLASRVSSPRGHDRCRKIGQELL